MQKCTSTYVQLINRSYDSKKNCDFLLPVCKRSLLQWSAGLGGYFDAEARKIRRRVSSANTATERAREEDEENCQQNADRKVGEQ